GKQPASANKQQVVGDRSETHDLVSSYLHVPCVPGMANVVALLGVPLNTLGDIDKLTKDIELGKLDVWSDLPSEKRTEVMETIWAMWDAFMVENPNVAIGYSLDSGKSDPMENRVKGSTNLDDTIHVDESQIVQSVIVQEIPNYYAGAAGGSKLVPSKPKPNKSKGNFRSLPPEYLCEGAKFSIPRKVVETVSARFANTLYGYFIGKRIAFSVMEYYVRNNWGKYGLTRIMMNSKGFFFFQFKTLKGLEDVLENGPWMIRNSQIILKKWTMNTRLCRKELIRIPVWVKIHDVPIQSQTMGVPLIEGSGFAIETVTIEYEWNPPRCDLCKIFSHVHDHCPKKKKKGKSKSTNGGQFSGPSVKQTVRYEPKATTSAPMKGDPNLGNTTKSLLKNQPLMATTPATKEVTMSNSYAALDVESDEDVVNVYDESATLFHTTRTGESSSFMAAVG
ncbi:zinc knuckle CX2CX4HX4C containing protein, partial [Tanacetum coccineum]